MARQLMGYVAPIGLLAALTIPHANSANGKPDHAKMIKATPATIKWVDAPKSLPKGAKIAVLVGDLDKLGPYTFRIKVPDGYRVPPHWHPADEHLTVLQGTIMMGMGEKFDEKSAFELPVGSFFMLPKGMKHYVWAKGDVVVQIHGIGPWGITYVNPADDPRKE